MNFDIVELPEAVSTNSVAASGGFAPGTLLFTLKQTGGRGCGTNRWESEEGMNISMTLVLAPETMPASKQFAISMAVALGCFDFVSRHTGGCSIKWPNDIYVGDRKIAGILIENTVSGADVIRSLCGIGLNLNQTVFRSDAPNPVSLRQITGRFLNVRDAIVELAADIDARLAGVNDFRSLKKYLTDVLYRREGFYLWSDANGVFEAEIAGIDDFGRLILRCRDGSESLYGFKEVRYEGIPNVN